jgi:hypothetical protein
MFSAVALNKSCPYTEMDGMIFPLVLQHKGMALIKKKLLFYGARFLCYHGWLYEMHSSASITSGITFHFGDYNSFHYQVMVHCVKTETPEISKTLYINSKVTKLFVQTSAHYDKGFYNFMCAESNAKLLLYNLFKMV